MDNSALIGKLRKYKTENTKKYKPNTFVLDVTNPRERFALWVDKNGDSELLFSENGLKFECKVIKRNGHEDEWMWFPTACSEYCDHIIILGDNEELYLKLLKIFDVHDLIVHPLALFRELLDLNPDADAECKRYEAVVKELGGQDLQLLGMGHNGHIGFNEPADEFVKETHCVDLQESTIQANKRFFEKVEDVPTQAYTMGIGTIMQAKKILVIASGTDKAEIVKKAFFGPITPQVPASILQLHPDVTVVVDEAAGSLI